MIWRLPSGQTYITTPGSALLFPALMVPTGDAPAADTPTDRRGDKTAMMPKRRRTRRQSRAARIAAERAHNRAERQARQVKYDFWGAPIGQPPPENGEPPPFYVGVLVRSLLPGGFP